MWLGLQIVGTAVGSTNDVLLASLSAAALALRPFTIMRSRVRIWYESDQLAASETTISSIGEIVVKDQAVAAGVASLPKPNADPEAQWIWWEGLQDSFLLATAVGFQPTSSQVVDVDAKSSRKVGINEDMAIIISNTTLGAIVAVQGRTLIKLH